MGPVPCLRRILVSVARACVALRHPGDRIAPRLAEEFPKAPRRIFLVTPMVDPYPPIPAKHMARR